MKKAAAHPTTKEPSGSDHFTLGTLASDLLDTTWRIATPVIIFAAVGILIDIKSDTAPWCTLAGMVIGFALAGYLLKQQLNAVERKDN